MLLKIKEYIDDGDMGYNTKDALVELDRFVSLSSRNYRGVCLLQVGLVKLWISEETAKEIENIFFKETLCVGHE